MYEEAKKFTPRGVSSPVRAFDPYPLFAKGGKGCMVTDVDGNEYVDLCMAYGPLILGHSDERVMEAVREQLGRGTVYGMPSEPELGLLRRICSDVPCAESVRLTNSGTEATMHAVRLARGFTGKDGIVKIDGGFHGSNDALMVNGDCRAVPFSAGIPSGSITNTHVVGYNDPESLSALLESNDGIAAVIMEPVMGNNGVVPPKADYLKKVRSMTEKHGCLLIFDEVITGYRSSKGGAQGLFGVRPDLCTLGKIIGGGFPAGAVAGRKEIIESFAPAGGVYEAGTFSGNPITAVAGNATIDRLGRNEYDHMRSVTESIVSAMRDSIADTGTEACVQSAPSMFQVFFGKESVSDGREARSADRGRFAELFRFMLRKGFYLPPSAMEVEFLSTSHDTGVAMRFTEAFDSFLRGDVS